MTRKLDWNEISKNWQRVALPDSEVEGAWHEKPCVITRATGSPHDWDEDIYALTSIAAAYADMWRSSGYNISGGKNRRGRYGGTV